MPEAERSAASPGARATPGQALRAPGFFQQVLAIAGKDLRIEWRSREIAYTTLFLAALVVLIFAFAFISGADADQGPGVVAGILWVAVLFSGTVALGRTFDRERENEAVRSLLLAPVSRAAIYLGKLLATTLLMVLVEAAVLPLVALLFAADIAQQLALVALALLLGTLGFAAVGVVFSAALLRARSRDTLLASLLYPIVVPVFLAGAKSTSELLDPATPELAGALFWLQFLAVADIVFIAVGLWAFEPVVTGD